MQALVVNFDFKPLFSWLDEHDQSTAFVGTGRFARILKIRVACRPELCLGSWFDENSPRCSTLGDSLKKQRLQDLLLQNLMATMNGWSWELTRYFSGYPRPPPLASPHQITQCPSFHANAKCRRIKSGCHYQVAIVADDTWRCLDEDDMSSTHATSQWTIQENKTLVRNIGNSTTSFYTKIYLIINTTPHPASPRSSTQFTLRCLYDMSSPSTFLTLPGEIRNHIYLQVALDAPIVRLFEGHVVLPPLASVCRQIRKKMNGKYQKDATLNSATPIHALVTNFNFHSLSQWLDKHSRDLKDKQEAPRVLCITSVLLAPDAAADLSTPKDLQKDQAVTLGTAPETPTRDVTNRGAQNEKTLIVKLKLTPGALPRLGLGHTSSSRGTPPSGSDKQRTRFVKLKVVPGLRPRLGLEPTTSSQQRVSSVSNNTGQEAFERTTSDEYTNSLRVLEQSLEAWCCTWTSCETFDVIRRAEYRDSGICELDSAIFRGQADRSGTSYAIGWRVRIIHREHPKPRVAKPRAGDPHSLQRTGLCYRGDFCDHFFFRHMHQITSRNRRHSWRRIVLWLRYSMGIAHFFGSHHYHNSFQRERIGDETDDHPSEHCDPCTEVISFYQRLDRHNIKNKVFEREIERCWLHRTFTHLLEHGTKRVVPDDFSSEDPYRQKTRKAGSWEEDELNYMIYKMENWSLTA